MPRDKLKQGFQNKPVTAGVLPATWKHVAVYYGQNTCDYFLAFNELLIVIHFCRVWYLLQNILKPLLKLDSYPIHREAEIF